MFTVPLLTDIANNLLYEETYVYLCFGLMIFFVIFFFVGFKHPVRYGRLFKNGKTILGKTISSKWAFFLFNIIPTIPYLYIVCFYSEMAYGYVTLTVPAICWLTLRVFRGTIYAYKRSRYSEPWPLESALYFLLINTLLAVIQAKTTVASYPGFMEIKTIIAFVFWVVAFILGMICDFKATKSRFKPSNGYKIIKGGLFELVTSPNYFCEMIMWISWTLMFSFDTGCTTTLVALLPNVLGRSLNYHKWAQRFFKGSYPKKRTAIIPFVNLNAVLEASFSFFEYGGF